MNLFEKPAVRERIPKLHVSGVGDTTFFSMIYAFFYLIKDKLTFDFCIKPDSAYEFDDVAGIYVSEDNDIDRAITEGFTENKALSKFFGGDAKVYCDNDKNICIVKWNGRHNTCKIFSLIPQMCPNLGFQQYPNQAFIRELQTLIKDGNWSNVCQRVGSVCGLEEEFKAELIKEIAERFILDRRATWETKIQNENTNIAGWVAKIEASRKVIREAMAWLNGLSEDDDQERSLIQYFINHPGLEVDMSNMNSGAVYFTVHTPMENWDFDRYTHVAGEITRFRHNFSELRNHSEDKIGNKYFAVAFFDKIFDRERFTINATGHFCYRPGDRTIRTVSGKEAEGLHEIENPHIKQHGCIGYNLDLIAEAIKDGDMQMALEYTFAATANINPQEYGATFDRFLRYITNGMDYWKTPFLYEKATGNYMSPEDIYDELEEELRKQNNEQAVNVTESNNTNENNTTLEAV